MCTYLTVTTDVTGSGRAGGDWFALRSAVVTFDHPADAAVEHALCLDFPAASGDPSTRVAVELDADGARRLAESILAVLDHPDAAALR